MRATENSYKHSTLQLEIHRKTNPNSPSNTGYPTYKYGISFFVLIFLLLTCYDKQPVRDWKKICMKIPPTCPSRSGRVLSFRRWFVPPRIKDRLPVRRWKLSPLLSDIYFLHRSKTLIPAHIIPYYMFFWCQHFQKKINKLHTKLLVMYCWVHHEISEEILEQSGKLNITQIRKTKALIAILI